MLKQVAIASFMILASTAATSDQDLFILPVPKFNVTAQTLNDNQNLTLSLQIEDIQSQTGVCPYIVRKFEYSANKIEIEISKSFCVNDAFGKSRGVMLWMPPRELLTESAVVCLVLNKEKVGTLHFSRKTNEFSIGGFESCE